jgi:hypothetical protein
MFLLTFSYWILCEFTYEATILLNETNNSTDNREKIAEVSSRIVFNEYMLIVWVSAYFLQIIREVRICESIKTLSS